MTPKTETYNYTADIKFQQIAMNHEFIFALDTDGILWCSTLVGKLAWTSQPMPTKTVNSFMPFVV